MKEQRALKSLWLEGVEGRLCGREQAKALALREVWTGDGGMQDGHVLLRDLALEGANCCYRGPQCM